MAKQVQRAIGWVTIHSMTRRAAAFCLSARVLIDRPRKSLRERGRRPVPRAGGHPRQPPSFGSEGEVGSSASGS